MAHHVDPEYLELSGLNPAAVILKGCLFAVEFR